MPVKYLTKYLVPSLQKNLAIIMTITGGRGGGG